MDKYNLRSLMVKVLIIFSLFMLIGLNQVYANDVGSNERKCMMHKHEHMKIHINMYYELLAEKYAPDQVKVWQEIQKERTELKGQLKQLKEKGEIDCPKEKIKPWFKEHKEMQKQFTDAIEKRNGKQIKKILPQIIEHHQQLNDLYKEILNDMN